MSHTSGTSDQDNYKRATIGNVFSSTPINDQAVRRYTTSLSQIDPASSLSEGRTESRLQSQKKKTLKKQKKVLKNKKKSHKKRIQLNDINQVTSTEWDTESEESIEGILTDLENSSILKESDDAYINLFDDPCTPEKIRDAPNEFTNESPLHHSPIIRSSRRFHLISKKNIIEEHDKLLPVNIPSTEFRNAKETDKDEIILNRTNNVKIYHSKDYRETERDSQSSLEIYWNYTYPPECFSMSDLLWEEFIEKNREKISQYLAPPSARVSVKKYKSEFLHKFPDIPLKFESFPVLPKMICIRGYSDKVSQKWVTCVDDLNKSENKEDYVCQTKAYKQDKRKQKERIVKLQSVRETNTYDLENEIDVEFETGGRDGKRMSLSEFRQKRKRIETVSDQLSLIFCHSQQN